VAAALPAAGRDDKMECPKCKNSGLVAKKVKGRNVRVDRCSVCKGIWFDGQELGMVLNLPKLLINIPAEAKKQHFLCPRCDRPLYSFCYPQSLVIIDMCGKCGGIWLDDKEFNEIYVVRKALNDVKLQRKKIACPKCRHPQYKSEECVKCGIIFSKYRASKESQTTSIEEKSGNSDEFASIPGVKGALLKFIDSALTTLSQ
jgi:Zn-finger nucleic acid-binding protein